MNSLRVRLPLTVSLLIVAVLATFLASAYRQVGNTLVDAAGLRLQNSADQIASLLNNPNQRGAEARRIATSPAFRAYLQAPGEETRPAAEAFLATLSNNRQTVEVRRKDATPNPLDGLCRS